ncbi:hypothetical protein ACLB2K_068735 [Fragaria x ananassa]
MSTYEQKRPHVPKFGDWNNKAGTILYTVVFDKARKGKLKDGVKIMNPNDPEENPETFTVIEKKKVKEGPVKIKIPIVAGENGEYSLESETIAPQSSHIRSLSHRRHSFDEAELSVCSEKMSFKSNNSSHIQQRLRERSKKRSMDSLTKRTGSTEHHHKHSSISDIDMIPMPKFRDWYERNPKSGEDFTYKFNKVKKEQKSISDMFSAVLSSKPNNGLNANNFEKTSSISKICCFHLFVRRKA